jgi:hypothetical protein
MEVEYEAGDGVLTEREPEHAASTEGEAPCDALAGVCLRRRWRGTSRRGSQGRRGMPRRCGRSEAGPVPDRCGVVDPGDGLPSGLTPWPPLRMSGEGGKGGVSLRCHAPRQG